MTDEMVARAQTALGVELPDAYLALLRVQNGGYTTSAFQAHASPQPTSWSSDHVPFDSMFGIGEDDGGIMNNATLIDGWEMPKGLVLLTGDGHWWIALDYRQSGPDGPPSVVWFDNEIGEDIQLAPDFKTFVEGLRPSDEFGGD